MKPGWQSSEFWITLLGQLLALLALAGVIGSGDRDKLETALANAVTAIFTIASSAVIVVRYIRSRSELKAISATTSDPSIPFLVFFGLLLTAPAQAAPPVEKTCISIGRPQRTDPALVAALQQIAQNQQTIIGLLQQRQAPAPAPAPQIIVLTPPRQDIPLGGAPRQEIPLGGAPRQDIPLGGAPKQEVPLGGPPRQEVPLGSPPKQDVPLGEPKPIMPPASDGKPVPMRFQPAVWRR
ncbi:MAG: hypothetical protein K2R98_02370 [Gemmataceae bacterium]|nr:hypothetical protein [Gemmataceae bacterium]